jgi:steroid delta-isomerase-like uncharacterized protein
LASQLIPHKWRYLQLSGVVTMPSPREAAIDLLARYYAAFNGCDWDGVLACLTDTVAHDINQGARETGKAAFAAFLGRMDAAYAEQLRDIVIMANDSGTRAAAEFIVHGVYKAADAGLPPAHGQSYELPAGAFFELNGGLISRVSVYYNLADWISQVS